MPPRIFRIRDLMKYGPIQKWWAGRFPNGAATNQIEVIEFLKFVPGPQIEHLGKHCGRG